MTGLVTDIVVGAVKDKITSPSVDEGSALGNLQGRAVRPLSHWSSKLLWVSVATAVAAVAVALLAFFFPVVAAFSSILFPFFAVVSGFSGISAAIGAFFINRFVPQHTLESDVADFNVNMDLLREEVIELKQVKTSLEGDCAALTQDVDHFKEENAALTSEITDLKKQKDQLDASTLALHAENETISKDLRVLQGQLAIFQTENREFKEACAKLEELIAAYEKVFSEHNITLGIIPEQLAGLDGIKQSLSDTLLKLKEDLDAQMKEKELILLENQVLIEQVSQAAALLEKSKLQLIALQDADSLLKQQSAQILKENTDLVLSNEQLRGHIESIVQLTESLGVRFKESEATNIDIIHTADEIDKTQDEISGLVKDHKSLMEVDRERAEAITKQIQDLVRTLNSQKSELILELLTVKDDLKRLEDAKNQLELAHELLQKQIEELKSENHAAGEGLKIFDARMDDQAAENKRYIAAAGSLAGTIKSLPDILARMERINKSV